MTTITPVLTAPIGVVSPRLYGQFAEHLGRCCYDGLWVGTGSSIPNVRGFRTDVVEALKQMPTPMLRCATHLPSLGRWSRRSMLTRK